jgi:xylulokinase
MEGVAFAAARHLRIMEAAAGRPVERVIASGGGAKTALWLKIKASIYGVPVAVPAEAECGVIGCAAMAQAAIGRRGSLEQAVDALVRIAETVEPDPDWAAIYARMQPVFDRLYLQSQSLYDQLDALAS